MDRCNRAFFFFGDRLAACREKPKAALPHAAHPPRAFVAVVGPRPHLG